MQAGEKKSGKPKYEKPTVTDLTMPVASAQQTQGTCGEGKSVGDPIWGDCADGNSPRLSGGCNSGVGDDGTNFCVDGGGGTSP